MLRVLAVIAVVLIAARILGGPVAVNSAVHVITQILQVSFTFLLQIIHLMVKLIESR